MIGDGTGVNVLERRQRGALPSKSNKAVIDTWAAPVQAGVIGIVFAGRLVAQPPPYLFTYPPVQRYPCRRCPGTCGLPVEHTQSSFRHHASLSPILFTASATMRISSALALRADVVFLEVIGGYFGYCVESSSPSSRCMPTTFPPAGTPATTCSRGMACTGDSHHGDPAMERGTTMQGTLYVHSVMLPMLFNLHIHGAARSRFGRLCHSHPWGRRKSHGAVTCPWGGQ